MEVILLERVGKLGQMGDVVRVKDGFARNFLLPKGKALRATKENRSRFETMKVELEARNLEQRGEAEKVGKKLDGQSFTVLRQAAEGGQLYGSVIAARHRHAGDREGLQDRPQSDRAQHADQDHRHAQGADRAASGGRGHGQRSRSPAMPTRPTRLARGEDITVARTEEQEAQAEALATAESFFEPEAAEALQRDRRGRKARRGREVADPLLLERLELRDGRRLDAGSPAAAPPAPTWRARAACPSAVGRLRLAGALLAWALLSCACSGWRALALLLLAALACPSRRADQRGTLGKIARHGGGLLGARRVVLAQEARARAALELRGTAVAVRAGVGEHLRRRLAGVDIALRQRRARHQDTASTPAIQGADRRTAARHCPAIGRRRLNFTAKSRRFSPRIGRPDRNL